MKLISPIGLALALCLLAPGRAPAQVGKAAREAAEFLLGKFGRQAGREGAEALAGKLAAAAARHGDEVFAAARKAGPAALALADDAGENAPRVLRLLGRHGDDAVRALRQPRGMALLGRYGDEAGEALIRHPGIAAPVIDRLGEPAVKALGVLGPQGGRRLAILSGDIAASGKAPEIMGILTRFGDPAMEFLWKHKGVLAGGAALVAFVRDPEPFINGATTVTRVVAETGLHTLLVAAADVGKEAAVTIRWGLGALVLALVACIALVVASGAMRSPSIRRAAAGFARHVGDRALAALARRK
jgi:hypothetical protein